MTEPRAKSEILSETTKTYLEELWIEAVYGRTKEIFNKYIEKGLYTEEDSLTLVQKHYGGGLVLKNKERFENEYISGEPDYIMGDRIVDVKSSWDMHTYFKSKGDNKDYYWQGQGYMMLKDKKKFDLVYCLNNAPIHMIVAEKNRMVYQKFLEEGTDAYDEMELQVEKNMMFDDLKPEDRIKVFNYDYDEAGINKLILKIMVAREYMNNLKLN
jgi:hypothetical protein